MTEVWLLAARRTPVCNRDGKLAHLQAWQLGSAVIKALIEEAAIKPAAIDGVIMGNALYGGGNPARLAALDAGLAESTPALSVDTQCCSGMDAITLAAQQIRSGAADVLIAGGLESWSRAPLRYQRPLGQPPQAYERPPFSPWTDRDPDMLDAAAELASARLISRAEQEQYAVASHRQALLREQSGLINIGGVLEDEYSRDLKPRLCQRLPPVSGTQPYQLTAATIASQSDASALVLLLSDKALAELNKRKQAIRWLDGISRGADPAQPALAPIITAQELLKNHKLAANQLDHVQVMEAFAVQAMAFIQDLGLDPKRCNTNGGALSRGHPIGASGAVEIVNAFHALQRAAPKAKALCAIAAAGGLGSATILERA